LCVIGEKEVDQKSVSVRSRKEGELGMLPVSDLINKVVVENATRSL
jgi:threonyl-tRNA synthetase